MTFARHGRLAIDALIVVALAVIVVNGIMVSGVVLPTFGLRVKGYACSQHPTTSSRCLNEIAAKPIASPGKYVS